MCLRTEETVGIGILTLLQFLDMHFLEYLTANPNLFTGTNFQNGSVHVRKQFLQIQKYWSNIMLFEENQPLLVNPAAAARLLDISERKLWQMKDDGFIPYVKIGKLIKYHVPTIKKWIDDNTQNGDGN